MTSDDVKLRDVFAAVAMHMLFTHGKSMGRTDPASCATDAYAWADAMMRARDAKRVNGSGS